MSSVSITLPDNSKKEFNHSPTILEVAESIGAGLAKNAVAGRVNGEKELSDIRARLSNGDKLEIITMQMPEANEVIRHSAAHVMAEAVQEIWPDIKVTIGPVIHNGFYYDFDSPRHFTPEDIDKIQKKMAEVVKRNEKIVREDWPKEKAIATFKEMGERFKVEIIEGLDEETVGIYRQGNWFDLCRGPHIQSTGQIKAFQVLSIAGAYWRGDENNDQLQRIYATAFNDKKELRAHLARLEEAKKRDHRKVGKELGLFQFHQMSPGSPFFTGKGTTVYRELQGFLRDLYFEHGYQEVISPEIYDLELYHQSGHYENYRENMYFTKVDERDFSLKPMNCPGHCLLYSMERKSYRELPWRVADFGRLHRHERSGVIQGITRVRSFCQDDAHIFCTMDQLQDEIKSFMDLLNHVYDTLGMNKYRIYLSTRPEKRIGSDEVWDQAEGALKAALETLKLPFEINEGDGAFYGPKLDIMFVDALERDWQLGTLQCDFNMPEAFKLKYIGEDNSEHQPVMLHRAILGSLERFIGVYLEHCAGRLPTWLAPVQVQVLNVTDRQSEYCQELTAKIKSKGIRVHFDSRGEKLGFKIREGQMQRIPYLLIIGDKESENGTVSVRAGQEGKMINGVQPEKFIEFLENEISDRNFENKALESISV